MCGIAGSCNFSGKRVEPEAIKRMMDTLIHRGPDDEGIYISAQQYPQSSAQVGLGHRRLSIIDLETGHQPMSNEDNSIWIVFNGEIYNFLELRAELLSQGHHFKTRSDTEVILHLYEDRDLDCVNMLRGMFAFAIWDSRKERLFLARDRVGKKPLVYYNDGENLIFASEIKALLQNEIRKEIDHNCIDSFLTFGYIPSPQSIFKRINKLPPAHILTYEGRGLSTKRYWQLTYRKQRLSFAESKERLKEILTKAIDLRLISDVPLGVFLSGGMDSSTVVALMSKLSNSRVKTFTIGFEEADYNELEFTRLIARRFNTEHHEFIVRPNAFEILHKLVWHYNEPFGDSSCIPTYYVAKMAREFVTVALNGDGGDESFAGYTRYKGLVLARILKTFLPRPLTTLALTLFKTDEAAFTKLAASAMRALRIKTLPRYIEGILMGLLNFSDEWKMYASWISQFQKEQKDRLYSTYFKAQLNHDVHRYILELVEAFDSRDLSERAMQVDINSYLPEDLLVKMDIATMANSLEARSPFLDHCLMEFAASLPAEFKLRGLRAKFILKEVVRDLLPREVLRGKKMGFAAPLDKWFRGELKQFSYDTLLSKKSLDRGYFREDYIKTLLGEHTSGKFDHSPRIWCLLNLEIWHRIFVDQNTPCEIRV